MIFIRLKEILLRFGWTLLKLINKYPATPYFLPFAKFSKIKFRVLFCFLLYLNFFDIMIFFSFLILKHFFQIQLFRIFLGWSNSQRLFEIIILISFFNLRAFFFWRNYSWSFKNGQTFCGLVTLGDTCWFFKKKAESNKTSFVNQL